jgi:hypothetical protein
MEPATISDLYKQLLLDYKHRPAILCSFSYLFFPILIRDDLHFDNIVPHATHNTYFSGGR